MDTGTAAAAADAGSISAWALFVTSATPTLIVCILAAVGAALAHKVGTLPTGRRRLSAAGAAAAAAGLLGWPACDMQHATTFPTATGRAGCTRLPDRGPHGLHGVYACPHVLQAHPGREPRHHPPPVAPAGQHDAQVKQPCGFACSKVCIAPLAAGTATAAAAAEATQRYWMWQQGLSSSCCIVIPPCPYHHRSIIIGLGLGLLVSRLLRTPPLFRTHALVAIAFGESSEAGSWTAVFRWLLGCGACSPCEAQRCRYANRLNSCN